MPSDVETVEYKVKKNDNLWNIVKMAGFPPKDWKKILTADYNKDFVKKLNKENRSADKIFAGDIIFLPKFNSKDIAEAYKSIKEKRLELGSSLKSLNEFDRITSQLRDLKDDDLKSKVKALKALTKKYKETRKRILNATKPGAGEPIGYKLGKAKLGNDLRKSEGVYAMGDEIVKMEKNLKTSKFSYLLETTIVKATKLQKLINVTAKELQTNEAELSKMLKNPY
ncbi:hypothetical protein GV827_21475 [Sulfitobacter sp. JBTF-M27]|uniref:LysM domain-containing protein n=1 Tax=Sulfitobacter sediminilitoris TaxID=2698830 RepID=A0A6P0CIY6_9RHOB|nr:hypothetical protein [Sulfitobacter sediminilitoris]NEK24945.1 hypothetical protein [Sulfitobacter sediminilitoris]